MATEHYESLALPNLSSLALVSRRTFAFASCEITSAETSASPRDRILALFVRDRMRQGMHRGKSYRH